MMSATPTRDAAAEAETKARNEAEAIADAFVMAIINAKQKSASESSQSFSAKKDLRFIISVSISVCLFFYTFFRVILSLYENNALNLLGKYELYYMIGFWAIALPAWFFYEYFYLYLPIAERRPLDEFKYGQQVAGAIWAGILAVLIAYSASDTFKSKLRTHMRPEQHVTASRIWSRGYSQICIWSTDLGGRGQHCDDKIRRRLC